VNELHLNTNTEGKKPAGKRDVDWIHLTQDIKVTRQQAVNTAIILGSYKSSGNFVSIRDSDLVLLKVNKQDICRRIDSQSYGGGNRSKQRNDVPQGCFIHSCNGKYYTEAKIIMIVIFCFFSAFSNLVILITLL
jgi:hypothetical protein